MHLFPRKDQIELLYAKTTYCTLCFMAMSVYYMQVYGTQLNMGFLTVNHVPKNSGM